VTKLLLIAALFGALADRVAASHSAPPLLIDSPHSGAIR
jgi:hypothetical protein